MATCAETESEPAAQFPSLVAAICGFPARCSTVARPISLVLARSITGLAAPIDTVTLALGIGEPSGRAAKTEMRPARVAVKLKGDRRPPVWRL